MRDGIRDGVLFEVWKGVHDGMCCSKGWYRKWDGDWN